MYRKLEAETGVSHTLCKPIDPQRTDPGRFLTCGYKVSLIYNATDPQRKYPGRPCVNLQILKEQIQVGPYFGEPS